MMNLHLSHEQLCDRLLEATDSLATEARRSPDGVQTVTLKAAADPVEDHLLACPHCAAELLSLESSIGVFRDTTAVFADRQLAALKARPQTLLSPAASRHGRPLVWAMAAALLIAVMVPAGLHLRSLRTAPSIASTAVPVTARPSFAASSSVESDEALLQGIDNDLSSSVPAAMQPLADPISTPSTGNNSIPGRTDSNE